MKETCLLFEGAIRGRLTLKTYVRGKASWLCLCACGTEKVIRTDCLLRNTKSCGCYRSERMKKRNTTHGRRSTSEYHAWISMKDRCTNQNNPAWKNYGGRGIRVCAEWMASFESFLSHVGPRPAGFELDRINNDGSYEPGNVRWTSRSENAKNRRPRARRPDGTYA